MNAFSSGYALYKMLSILVPTAPRNLRLEIVENNPPRVKVTWTPPREAHGALKSYRLMWGKRGDDILASTASIINTRFSYIAQSMSKYTCHPVKFLF